jgi:hypothetical protein
MSAMLSSSNTLIPGRTVADDGAGVGAVRLMQPPATALAIDTATNSFTPRCIDFSPL